MVSVGLAWLFLQFVLVEKQIEAIKWIALTRLDNWRGPDDCPHNRSERKAYGLTGHQVRLCKEHADHMPYIISAANKAQKLCLEEFKYHRWNCSSIETAPRLSADLTRGTKEQAYVYALTSAILAHSVARGCRHGYITTCPCHAPTDGGKRYAVDYGLYCDVNPIHGVEMSEEFADSQWKARRRHRRTGVELSPQTKVNQHNNDIGRAVLKETVRHNCRCVGASGACTQKHCYTTLITEKDLAIRLKKKYYLACQSRKQALLRFDTIDPQCNELELTYMRVSPDYCRPNKRLGSLGTSGRICNGSSPNAEGSCERMCCGRGHYQRSETYSHACNCRYVHCCYVECLNCTKTVNVNYCY